MEERLEIETPEGVVIGYRIAGIGSRFVAALLDALIVAALLLVFACGLGITVSVSYSMGLGSWVAAVAVLVIFGLNWGYYIFFELVWNGQTPGKRRMGLRVIGVDGMPVTLVESLIRNLVRVIDFLPLYYTVGLITMFFNVQARRLGDFAAGTLVVKERRDVTLASIQEALSAAAVDLDVSLDVELGESEYELITDFLNRRQDLLNRDELAMRIASAIAGKLDLPQPASTEDAEAMLVKLANQSRQH